MCNIAGYVGSRPAAPILLDMMRKQEGFAGGYFSGIATIHDGKLYHAKLTGDIQRLTEQTDAATLPGTIGIIHSRSNSGGGDSWAHPFTRSVDGQMTEAYIANGYVGCATHRLAEYCQLAKELIDIGYPMSSRDNTPHASYPALPDLFSRTISPHIPIPFLRFRWLRSPQRFGETPMTFYIHYKKSSA